MEDSMLIKILNMDLSEILTSPFRIMKTENFFEYFQYTRENLKILSEYDNWALRKLEYFNKEKSRIKIISKDGKLCYIPIGLKSDLDFINKMAEEYRIKV